MVAVFVILVGLHAFIHLMGTVKAFSPSSLPAFTAPVSRAQGIFWLLGFVGLALVAVFFSLGVEWWWALAVISVVWSQVCIFLFWREARYGTIPNMVILAVAIVSCSAQRFDAQVEAEWEAMQPHATSAEEEMLTLAMTEGMPLSVQRWLLRSGAVGSPVVRGADLAQDFQMKLTPDQEGWYKGRARQRIDLVNQGFVWDLEMSIWPGIGVRGRDQLHNGQGEMVIKAFGAIPVASEGHNDRINEATLQRFLGELVWLPSGAVNKQISWTFIDQHTAQATLQVGHTEASGIFAFDENFDFKRFTALRYMDSDADAERVPWVVEALEVKSVNGVRIPVRTAATWQLNEGPWTWAEIEVRDLKQW